MGLLSGKRGLVMGVANDKSVAWGIAHALHQEGATLGFTYQGDAFGKRVTPLAESIGASALWDVDVSDDAALDTCFEAIKADWGTLDFIVHAIAFANKDDLTGRFRDTSRTGFRTMPALTACSPITMSWALRRRRLKPRFAIWRRILAKMAFALTRSARARCARLRALPLAGHAKSSATRKITHRLAMPRWRAWAARRRIFSLTLRATRRVRSSMSMAGITCLEWAGKRISEVIDGLILPTLATVLLCSLTLRLVRGGIAIKPGQVETNLSGRSLMLGALSVAAAIFITQQVEAGIILVLGIALHEFGHVAAYRAMGHNDARFRLIPFLGGVAISRKLPRDQLTDFYVVFMGPGIMLAPVAIAGLLAEMTAPHFPYFANLCRITFVITGAINFFNLLPFWPLDGGRILRTLTYALSPRFSQGLTLVMSVGLAGWALYAQLPLIFIVALFGFQSARHVTVLNKKQAAMHPPEALFATIAYLAALAAHGLAGRDLITSILTR